MLFWWSFCTFKVQGLGFIVLIADSPFSDHKECELCQVSICCFADAVFSFASNAEVEFEFQILFVGLGAHNSSLSRTPIIVLMGFL